MNDFICRQAAIQIVKACKTGNCLGMREAAEKIEELPAMPQWIPCRVKCPDKPGDYLVQGGIMGNYGIFVCRWEGTFWGVKTPVIAWMELPEMFEPVVGVDVPDMSQAKIWGNEDERQD